MKWIEMENGDVVNFEHVDYISKSSSDEVLIHCASGDYFVEKFETAEDAEARLEELKKKLL